MSRLDRAKDAIDIALAGGSRSEAALRRRLANARDLIEYIELHYSGQLAGDLAERVAERRRTRRTA